MGATDNIRESGLIVIVRGVVGEAAERLALALRAGGVRAMELTFDQLNTRSHALTEAAIARIRDIMGADMSVGAGTVTSADLVRRARGAGAEFIVSPDTNREVICETKRLNMTSIPGAMTPSEILSAHRWGADFVKLFPAGALGVEYFKAVRAPINHIPLLAVGGVDASNARAFLSAGASGLGVGGNIADKALISAGRYDEITRRARAILEITKHGGIENGDI